MYWLAAGLPLCPQGPSARVALAGNQWPQIPFRFSDENLALLRLFFFVCLVAFVVAVLPNGLGQRARAFGVAASPFVAFLMQIGDAFTFAEKARSNSGLDVVSLPLSTEYLMACCNLQGFSGSLWLRKVNCHIIQLLNYSFLPPLSYNPC